MSKNYDAPHQKNIHQLGLKVRKQGLLLFIGILCCVSSQSFGQYDHVLPLENYDLDSFEGRAQLIVESMADYGVKNGVWTGEKNGAYPAMAMFATGNIEQGRHFAREQLKGSGAMFREFGNMMLYMSYQHLYDQELRDLVKDDQLNHSVLYSSTGSGNLPGASENHKLMYAAANYLGGLAWPDEYPDLWYNAGYNYLINWFNKVTTSAYWEEDSPTYFVHHIGPILSVMEFAPDTSEMKKRATIAFEWYMAGVAAEYLKGYWITPSARDKNPVHGLHLSEESIATLWLYFGETGDRLPHPHPTDGHEAFRHWYCAVHFATAHYRLPEAIVNIAKDRDKPYSFKEYLGKNPMKPAEYGFMNKHYGLTSMVDWSGNPPPDMTQWKLQWVPDEFDMEPCVFLMKHPNPEDNTGWKNWKGASPYEQVFQHERTLVSIFDIPEIDTHHFIDGPYDSAVYRTVMQKDDWWFFHTGELLFAVYAQNGLFITGETRIAYDHFGTTAPTGIIRSNGTENFLIVETALREDYSAASAEEELNLFAEDLFNNTLLETSVNVTAPVVEFRNLQGDWIKMEYDGERSINDSVVSFANWPMIENPWMSQERAGRYLTVRHGSHDIIYDFGNWEKSREEENINLFLNISSDDTIQVNPEAIHMEALPDKDTSIIEQVNFYINGHLSQSDSTQPYTFDWTNPAPGKYRIESKLLTSEGNFRFSNEHHLIISDGTPVIEISAPKEGKYFLVNEALEITTETADYDGVIDSVQFYINGSRAGVVISSPFTWLWSDPVEGACEIHAVAWDDDLNSDTTAVNLQLIGYNEAIDIDNIKNGLVYSYFEGNWLQLPDFENISALETDTVSNFLLHKRKRNFEYAFSYNGLIKIHEKGKYIFHTTSDLESKLYIDGHLLVHNAGLSQEENAILLEEGFHKIKAEMVNKMSEHDFEVSYKGPGFEKQSIPDSILFRPYGNKPEISFITVPGDTIFNAGDPVYMKFAVEDADNDDYKVILYEGDNEVAELHKHSYSANIDSLGGGIHQLKAVVYDLEGATAETAFFAVSINGAPDISFESPVQTREYYSRDTIQVIVSTPDNDIREMQIYLNEQLVTNISKEPWKFELRNLEQGNYFLKVIATDTLNLESTIKTSFIIINSVPQIEITQPVNGATFSPGEKIVLQAQLTDVDDDVYKVAFYENNLQIGQNANIFHQTTLNNFPEGNHAIIAKAFDKEGAVGESDTIHISVNLSLRVMENSRNNLLIFPNPLSKGELTVRVSNIPHLSEVVIITIHNIAGQIIYEHIKEGTESDVILPYEIFNKKGIYYIILKLKDETNVEEIIVH